MVRTSARRATTRRGSVRLGPTSATVVNPALGEPSLSVFSVGTRSQSTSGRAVPAASAADPRGAHTAWLRRRGAARRGTVRGRPRARSSDSGHVHAAGRRDRRGWEGRIRRRCGRALRRARCRHGRHGHEAGRGRQYGTRVPPRVQGPGPRPLGEGRTGAIG